MSRFSALKSTRLTSDPAEAHTVVPAPLPDPVAVRSAPAKAGKRRQAGFRQFSAYLRADTYRELKRHVTDREMELSEAVNLAIDEWLVRQR